MAGGLPRRLLRLQVPFPPVFLLRSGPPRPGEWEPALSTPSLIQPLPTAMKLSRREIMKLGLGASALAALPRLLAQTAAASESLLPLVTKPIPSTGERLPVIGIGTARRYESLTDENRSELTDVLRLFPELGGRVIDTAPAYGDAESIVGELIAGLGNRSDYFFATKVSGGGGGRGGRGGPGGPGGRGDPAAAGGRGRGDGPPPEMPEGFAARGGRGRGGAGGGGLEQIEQSFANLRTDMIDLVAVWNLGDVDNNLALLRDLKAEGRIRYLGVTTSSDGQYEQLEQVMTDNELDFVQVDYAIDNRTAEERILPLAADRGIGVMTNLPFGRERLWNLVDGKELPEWAAEIDATTWAQFMLKFVVSHPSVTCAIPGTARVAYVTDNNQAARGRMPDAAMRTRMAAYMESL